MNNQARTESTVGEIVNLMSVDAEHIKDLSGYLWGVWSSPLQIIGSVVYLYYTVGYAMFAGLAVMILLVPFNMVILTNAQKCEKLVMERKDDRIKLMTEILNGIKVTNFCSCTCIRLKHFYSKLLMKQILLTYINL
jgi:hypothetical protein